MRPVIYVEIIFRAIPAPLAWKAAVMVPGDAPFHNDTAELILLQDRIAETFLFSTVLSKMNVLGWLDRSSVVIQEINMSLPYSNVIYEWLLYTF